MDDQPRPLDNLESKVTVPLKGPTRGVNKLLLALLVLACAAAGVGGGYWYGHKPKAAAVVTSDQSKTSSQSPTTTLKSNQGVHFVESLGYTRPSAAYRLVTKLGIPDSMQAVRVSSDIQNQGQGFQMFGDGTFNNELGRWELGDPTDSLNNSGGTSEISLTDISTAWLSKTGTDDYSNSSLTFNSPLQTPDQKKQFMTQVESSTAACAKDSSKGFATADGSLNICYTYTYGLPQGYSPFVNLIGYGNIKDQPIVLVGFIKIYDPSQDSGSLADLGQLNTDIKNGKVPSQTAAAQKAIISALKQTTVTASPNPLANKN